ncbi:Small ribosomal subunit bioproteinsis [Saitoella coloradoensis]
MKLNSAGDIKIYTVSGQGATRALPDWLARRKRKALRDDAEYRSRIELVQEFEFPEASNKIKVTRDGNYAMATGTYKPHIRLFDFKELTLKFERHTDAENVNFVLLSEDWTKSAHLQSDRSVEVHAQGGIHYRTRIPKFGRDIGYHFNSCDLLVGASGNEVYRLNLDQGRFLAPFEMAEGVEGVNSVEVNPVHQLFAFGTDTGTVELWDPRYRSRVGVLDVRNNLPLDVAAGASITTSQFRSDGLSFGVGTSSGHTLLYDLRSSEPWVRKDQGYSSPINSIRWLEGTESSNRILTSDAKIIKIWDKDNGDPFTSIEPPVDINDVCPLPGTGLIFVANEGMPMHTYYIPQLGPAPAWCSFLDNLTEEMEETPTTSVYDNYKFVTRKELSSLGLDHLIGTNVVRAYMHGFFLDLRLYEKAKLIANPFAYAEHRAATITQKIDAERESRIRSKKVSTKVNKTLAERLLKAEERAAAKGKESAVKGVLEDGRFKAAFEDEDFAVDEKTVEFMQLNPTRSAARGLTAAEEEEEEERAAKNGISSDESSESESEEEQNPAPKKKDNNKKKEKPKMTQLPSSTAGGKPALSNTQKSFASLVNTQSKRRAADAPQFEVREGPMGEREITFTVEKKAKAKKPRGGDGDEEEEGEGGDRDRDMGRTKARGWAERRSASKNVFRGM